MFHLVLIGIIAALWISGWALIRTSPRVLSMLLPRGLTFGVGAGLFVISGFSAFTAAYALQSPEAMLGSIVQGYIGLWLMLATSSGARGSYVDDLLLQRVSVMLAMVLAVIVVALYLPDARVVATLNLGLILCSFILARDFMRRLNRGR